MITFFLSRNGKLRRPIGNVCFVILKTRSLKFIPATKLHNVMFRRFVADERDIFI